MGANKLRVHPAFYRRVRHYRDRNGIKDGRPRVASDFVRATHALVSQLLKQPQRGHPARETLTVITLEHTAQDLPSRLASIVSKPIT